jgi:hypothetical protein
MIGPTFDGLDALRAELSLAEIMRLIERTARWVSRETFERLPVWYPEHTRRGLFYKANWSEPQLNTNQKTKVAVHKHEGNNYASKALTHALGLRSRQRPNWSCCHIWSVDDPTVGSSNVIVQDARFYSCVANMVLLPTPLKAFTDVMPAVKWMLRACAFHTYGWRCDHDMLGDPDLVAWTDDAAYPASWPKWPTDAPPPGTVPMTTAIALDADCRLAAIHRDLQHAGRFYPREAVRQALSYWRLPLPSVKDYDEVAA